ncbi:MAG: thioredoxin [Proteobacteria bacterium]|nr:thioredoxin [Pseudomonadota bacterium]
MSDILEVNDDNFEAEVINSDKPVLIDFWAPWCGPCRAIAPIIDELAKVYDQIKFVKCNVDDNPVTPGKYEVQAIPTLLFIKDGKVADSITGMVAKNKLEETIKKLL